MSLANMEFKITDKIEEAADFMELTDAIIQRIKWRKLSDATNEIEKKRNDDMRKAKALIHRMDTRNLYKCVAYLLLDSNTVAMHGQKLKSAVSSVSEIGVENKDPNTNEIVASNITISEKIEYHGIEMEWKKEIFAILQQQTNDFEAFDDKKQEEKPCKADDILCCQLMSLSYGMETKHPIHNVRFYNPNNLNACHRVELDQITFMNDESRFREVIFRVFVKNKACAKELKAIKKTEVDRSLHLSPKTIKTPPRQKGKRVRDQFCKVPNPMFADDDGDKVKTPNKKRQKLNQ